MPHFLHEASYTAEAVAKLIAHPQDRFQAIREPIERLGGRIHASFFAFGEYDVVLLTEFPDNVSAAAIALAFTGGGALKSLKTTALLTTVEALEAMRKAAACGYRPVAAAASAAPAPSTYQAIR